MGMNVGSSRSNKRSGGSLADINVTPLVDILLVLLIIFMVTAPMIHHGASVPAPDVSPQDPKQPPPQDSEKTTLFMDQSGKLSYRNQPILDIPTLAKILKADPDLQKNQELYLQADPTLSYGRVMEVIGTMRKAGVKKIGMVVSPEDIQER